MDGPISPLSHLGAQASAALDAYSSERARAIETARRQFLDAARRHPEPARRGSYHAIAAAAALAAVVALVVVLRGPGPLEFTADGRPGLAENWVAAPLERAVALDFSDGSSLLVQPSSRARVVAIDRHGASVALENGRLSAHVLHRSESAWRVIAGPLTVRVTGTRFNVIWSAPKEEFAVEVSEGSVSVAGPLIGAERAVKAGETLRIFVGERRVEWTAASATPAEGSGASLALAPTVKAGPPVPSQAPTAEPAAELRERRVERVVSEKESQLAPEPDWRELIRAGSLRNAFAAAEARGFGAVCREASAAELLALGDGARLSGRPDRANEALRLLRSRYPADPRRAAAAFALGKVAFDEARDYRQAAEWFSISIREQPAGSLSREAAGRLLEALQRTGDSVRTKRAAQDYLDRYPSGPHAALARSILR